MIGQYLSNTNENAIVSISQKILELNKALSTTMWTFWVLYCRPSICHWLPATYMMGLCCFALWLKVSLHGILLEFYEH